MVAWGTFAKFSASSFVPTWRVFRLEKRCVCFLENLLNFSDINDWLTFFGTQRVSSAAQQPKAPSVVLLRAFLTSLHVALLFGHYYEGPQ